MRQIKTIMVQIHTSKMIKKIKHATQKMLGKTYFAQNVAKESPAVHACSSLLLLLSFFCFT